MKKLMITLAAVAAAVAIAPAANAADVITITGASGTFGNSSVTCSGAAPCGFSSTFNFMTPTGYNLSSATISSAIAGNDAATNIDFSSVTLNGVQFNIVTSGVSEFRDLLNQFLVTGGSNVISVQGTTGGNASFSGALSFSKSAVPEPATWALMLLGFAAVGYSMRRRPTVRFAQAV